MMAKAMLAIQKTYWNAKNKLNTLKNDERGMETLEVVILIVIAVIVALLVLNFLTGSGENEGIVQQLFTSIAQKLGIITNAPTDGGTVTLPASTATGS